MRECACVLPMLLTLFRFAFHISLFSCYNIIAYGTAAFAEFIALFICIFRCKPFLTTPANNKQPEIHILYNDQSHQSQIQRSFKPSPPLICIFYTVDPCGGALPVRICHRFVFLSQQMSLFIISAFHRPLFYFVFYCFAPFVFIAIVNIYSGNLTFITLVISCGGSVWPTSRFYSFSPRWHLAWKLNCLWCPIMEVFIVILRD